MEGNKKKVRGKSKKEREDSNRNHDQITPMDQDGMDVSESKKENTNTPVPQCSDGYVHYDDMLKEPALASLPILPQIQVVDKELRKYNLANCLTLDAPSIVFEYEDPENKPAYLAFSCYVKHFGLIPSYFWRQVPCRGIAKLGFDQDANESEKAYFEVLLQHKPDGKTYYTADPQHYELVDKKSPDGCRYELKKIVAKLDPDHVMVDNFTIALIEDSNITFKTKSDEPHRITHMIMQDSNVIKKRNVESDAIANQKETIEKMNFRRESIIKASEEISANQKAMTGFLKDKLHLA